ncbi:sulfatase-like hydrolase/transferase [candidate division KSB1 bacterium]|nr:sulfatase-like hydrolase/transferase [candidate division KSB1 bacterium]
MANLSRRQFLYQAAILAGNSLLSRRARAGSFPSTKPNIILCMSDDQGWGDVGYNDHPELRSPNLDDMALQGIRFERFYSGAPVCSPTRGSCLTGRHPYRYGIFYANSGHVKQAEITLAEALKTLGYRTGHFGKWHLGTLTHKIKDSNRGAPGNTEHYAPPWDHGFDVCFSTEAKIPTYWHADTYESYGTYYWTGPEEKVPETDILGDDSTLIMDRALPFIRDAARDHLPFLAVIWFHAPHLPVASAAPYTDGYTKHKDYYGCITAMDEQMGRLRNDLQQLGIEDNTMIWFCSDNGPEGNDQAPGLTKGLRGRKRSLYEGGIRVPGLLVWPAKIKTNRVVRMPCSTNDYFPTVMDILGYKIPETDIRPYDGESLWPLLNRNMDERPRPIGFQSRDQLALIDNRYKLYSPDRGQTYELYDLIKDPAEKNDLIEQEPLVAKKMQARLQDWLQSCRESLQGKDY